MKSSNQIVKLRWLQYIAEIRTRVYKFKAFYEIDVNRKSEPIHDGSSQNEFVATKRGTLFVQLYKE